MDIGCPASELHLSCIKFLPHCHVRQLASLDACDRVHLHSLVVIPSSPSPPKYVTRSNGCPAQLPAMCPLIAA